MSQDDINDKHGRKLSKGELALWRAVTRDVDLADGAAYQSDDRDTQDFASMMQGERVQPLSSFGEGKAESAGEQRVSKAQARDLDKRTEMRLSRGQLDIQGRIDLHGFGQAEAQRALNSFLLNAYAQGKRCVLVITGKGKIVMDEAQIDQTPGVLRRSLPDWVREAPLDHIVLSIAQASSKHGGGGAYYVLLRRKR